MEVKIMIRGLINEELKKEYGVIEVNSIPDGYHEEEIEEISWEELKGKKGILAERLRLVSDPGYPTWDCSYFHVKISGVKYRVLNHPFGDLKKRGLNKQIFDILQKEKIFVKGIFDCISTLN
jgi:hypothetical protein